MLMDPDAENVLGCSGHVLRMFSMLRTSETVLRIRVSENELPLSLEACGENVLSSEIFRAENRRVLRYRCVLKYRHVLRMF
ncbi:hypothetical protein RHGRI_034236 [Rhododendron griersonianum]|uniref:Uncharacterized protein n=1 Tax=Rhododendron griersonianum TaxID=479676 RepID=A0AAV6I2P1_9ERIC|nr:hypothetical protein RHGRI_034236 [Rhododendron griersonianum]